MITFTANVRSASARSDDAITTSSVGIPINLVLADEFMGLAKTLVFRAGATTVDVVLVGDATEAVVPPDVLTTVGLWLGIGIYAADGDGNVVIPTVWASAGLIQQGTVPSGVDPSEPTPSWVAQVQSIASEASENAETALNKATAVEEAAAQGDFDGADGVSPTVSVSNITGGHRVTITDADGSHVFDVMDGVNGTDGTDGTDGYSPTVTVEEITGGHRVTITDVDGDHSFDVMDGTGGGGGTSDYTDLSNKPSINGVTLSGNKTASDLSLGTYSKPSGGIPATDLASAVQTSLGKADTALQSAPVTSVNGQTGAVTVSVPSASSATPQALGTAAAGSSGDFSRADHVHAKPTYSKSDVGLGNVDNVQQYSANNPPPYPVTSVNGSTGAVTLSIPSSASDVGAVASNQGSGNAGKVLGVGNDGTVTPVDGGTGVSDSLKSALLQIASKVAYIDANGQAYYDALMLSLYPDLGHTITNTLSHCSNSNPSGAILDGNSYAATITADDGYSLQNGTIVVTMGGVDITATAYSGGYANGAINIASVTGDVIIAVTAAAESLPAGYTRYDYIYNLSGPGDNKNGLLDTGISSSYCDTKYIHEVTLALISVTTGTNSAIYGCRNASGSAGSKNGNSFWVNTADKIAVGYNGVDSGYTLQFTWANKHTVKLDTGKVYIDGELVSSPTATRTSYSTSSIRLFGAATNESSYSGVHGTMKFYSVMITDSSNGNVIAKLVPCKNGSDIAGMYDLVSGTFHYATNYTNYAVANEA